MASPSGNSNRDAILRALRLSSSPLDDDELSVRTDITPRQQVNQICRRLQTERILDRINGPGGKIVNVLRAALPTSALASVDMSDAGEAPPELPAGNSREQRDAERHLLASLSALVGKSLTPAVIRLPSSVRVEVDGADEARTVLVECWAHIGKVKVAQRHKVLTDAFKLIWIANNIPGRPRLILCIGDDDAAAPFRNRRTWYGQALADQGIEVFVVTIPTEVREAVLLAQRRQFR